MKITPSRLIITSALLGLTLLAPVVLHAQADSKLRDAPAGSVGPLMEEGRPAIAAIVGAFREANIDASQRDQIKAVLKKYYPTVNPLIDKLIAEHKKLREVIHASPIDEAAIRQQSAAVAAVNADLAVQHAYISAEIRTILRPEQLEKFKSLEGELAPLLEQHRARFGEWLMKS